MRERPGRARPEARRLSASRDLTVARAAARSGAPGGWQTLLFVVVALAAPACRPRVADPAPAPPPPAEAPHAWPRTVAEAVALKLRTMPDGEKATIRGMPRERVQDLYHGFQMLHRADFGLGEGNEALLASCGSVRMPAEECMRVILDALWVALQGHDPSSGHA